MSKIQKIIIVIYCILVTIACIYVPWTVKNTQQSQQYDTLPLYQRYSPFWKPILKITIPKTKEEIKAEEEIVTWETKARISGIQVKAAEEAEELMKIPGLKETAKALIDYAFGINEEEEIAEAIAKIEKIKVYTFDRVINFKLIFLELVAITAVFAIFFVLTLRPKKVFPGS